jgi:hypothetical protein
MPRARYHPGVANRPAIFKPATLRPGLALVLWAPLALLAGCRSSLNLGSNVIWSTDHESGDLSDWLADSGGGTYSSAADGATVSKERAHSGRFSLRLLTATAAGGGPRAGAWREGAFPKEAFYSAWYYLPRTYQTISFWTILKFETHFTAGDLAHVDELIDVNLRAAPGGELIVYVFDHRREYLQSPIAQPTPIVPVGRWFHLEAFYRNANDDTGRLTIWLDGGQIYDIAQRPTGADPSVYWTPCNVTDDISPDPAEIFVDDAAIALSRVGPTGVAKIDP